MYELNEHIYEVEIEAMGFTVRHRLERPSRAQLIERDTRVRSEEKQLDAERIETTYEDIRANIRLWDECAREVEGYDLGDNSKDWRTVDEALRGLIPPEHKHKAVLYMYLVSAEAVKPSLNGHGFPLMGATEVPIKLFVGDKENPAYEITHVFRRPSESEWVSYYNGIMRIVQVKGSRNAHYITQANLPVHLNFYDALLTRIEGATLDGKPFTPETREAFLKAIDPIHKRAVTNAFADHWRADQKK